MVFTRSDDLTCSSKLRWGSRGNPSISKYSIGDLVTKMLGNNGYCPHTRVVGQRGIICSVDDVYEIQNAEIFFSFFLTAVREVLTN
jgi:hypothetical protein